MSIASTVGRFAVSYATRVALHVAVSYGTIIAIGLFATWARTKNDLSFTDRTDDDEIPLKDTPYGSLRRLEAEAAEIGRKIAEMARSRADDPDELQRLTALKHNADISVVEKRDGLCAALDMAYAVVDEYWEGAGVAHRYMKEMNEQNKLGDLHAAPSPAGFSIEVWHGPQFVCRLTSPVDAEQFMKGIQDLADLDFVDARAAFPKIWSPAAVLAARAGRRATRYDTVAVLEAEANGGRRSRLENTAIHKSAAYELGLAFDSGEPYSDYAYYSGRYLFTLAGLGLLGELESKAFPGGQVQIWHGPQFVAGLSSGEDVKTYMATLTRASGLSGVLARTAYPRAFVAAAAAGARYTTDKTA